MLGQTVSRAMVALQGPGDGALAACQRQIRDGIVVATLSLGDQDTERACQLDAAALVHAATRTVRILETNGDGVHLALEALEPSVGSLLHVLTEERGLRQAFPTNIDAHTSQTPDARL